MQLEFNNAYRHGNNVVNMLDIKKVFLSSLVSLPNGRKRTKGWQTAKNSLKNRGDQ
jgi:hypothetical protein